MYWATDAKKTETRPLLQRSKLFPAELTFKNSVPRFENGIEGYVWTFGYALDYRDSLDADKNLMRHYSLSQNSPTHGLWELKAKTGIPLSLSCQLTEHSGRTSAAVSFRTKRSIGCGVRMEMNL